MEVSVASAIEGYLLDDAVVIDGHIDELRAGALGFVEGVFHIRSFFSVATSSSLILLPNYWQTSSLKRMSDTVSPIPMMREGFILNSC